jgi:hypothetical protein
VVFCTYLRHIKFVTSVSFQLLFLSSYQNIIHLMDTEFLNIKIVAQTLSRIKFIIIIIIINIAVVVI